jgi:Fic family protein
MLTVEGAGRRFRMEPGAFRSEALHDVSVGRHVPPSSSRVAAFMAHFAERYRFARLGKSTRIIAMAAAHHRLNYIHPFPDGNGRVSRLMSHAMALEAGIGAGGLWSISRGLARGLQDAGEYKRMMDATDAPRRGALDGRGNLSQQALVEFVRWFVDVALDQVTFMATLFDFDALSNRLHHYATEELGAADDVGALLADVLRRGSIPRGDVARITGRSERGARNQLKLLTEAGLLASTTPKGAVSLRFDSGSAETLFPRLFPAQQG